MSETDGDSSSEPDRTTAGAEQFGLTSIRPRENPVGRWILLSGNRIAVTAALLLAVFIVLIVLSLVRPVDMRRLVAETSATRTLFNTLLSGAILLVSIVVSINSTALSQEITDVESQQERIDATIEYRKRLEEFLQREISPTQPAEFLTVILGAIARQTQTLADAAADNPNEEFERDVDIFVDEVADDLEHARGTLRDAPVGSFEVLLAGLNYDYTGQLHAARRFKREFEGSLDEKEQELIDDLVDTLEFFATGREYFKSLYYERELAKLSSQLLYVSLPVIVFTSYVIFALDGTLVPEMSLYPISSLLLFVSFAYTVALAPYVILTAYIIRLSAITLQTLASGPFIFQQRSDIDVFDRDASEKLYGWDLPGKDE